MTIAKAGVIGGLSYGGYHLWEWLRGGSSGGSPATDTIGGGIGITPQEEQGSSGGAAREFSLGEKALFGGLALGALWIVVKYTIGRGR